MRLIYIAGPYRAINAWQVECHVRTAEEAGLAVAELGLVPVIPHTMYRFFDGALTDQYWLDATIELLRKCDAALFVGAYRASAGSMGELAECEMQKIPAFTNLDDLKNWLEASTPEAP